MIPKEKLSQIVGVENAFFDDAVLKEYAGDMSFAHPVRPAAVLNPRTAAQVAQIVALAKETRTPLVPVSSGAPHFRGDTVPSTGGAVVIDLSGMKKIIHTDRKNRAAMFEPGVTFGELSEAVAKDGMRLNMPLLPRATKSVLGSLLEREPPIMPKYHWDISDPLACLEVIFGTGETFRTGAAAGSGTIEEQWAAGGAQKEAAGPSAASLYRLIQGSQGSMGICTWASVRCELIPALEESYWVGAPTLEKILETIHWLMRLRLANECFVLNNTNLAQIMAAAGPQKYSQIKESAPSWLLFFNIAAYDFLPEERLEGQKQDVLELSQRLGIEPAKTAAGIPAADFLKITRHPSPGPCWKLFYKGGCHDLFFLANYDDIPAMVETMYLTAAAAGFPTPDIGVYLQPIVQGTNCHCEFNLLYNPNDPAEAARARDLSLAATEKLLARGAFFSRPYGESAGTIMNRDAATVNALKKVKAVLDPQGIMNPGKLCF